MYSKLIMAAGAGLFSFGALVGWALTADYYEQRMKENDESVDREMDLMDQKIDALVEKDANLRRRLEAEFSPEETTDENGDDDEVDDEVDEAETEAIRSNLQSLIDSYTNDPDTVEVFVNNAGKTMERDYTPPFVISREKYAWDEDEGDDYAKITLMYYPRERLLLDDEEDTVDDVAGVIGWKNLAQFGGESGDPDVVFIRNRRLLTDFEVVRDDENPIPLHIKYGMSKAEFESGKAAGVIKFRPEDI